MKKTRVPSVHVLVPVLKELLQKHFEIDDQQFADFLKDITSVNIDRGTLVLCKTTKDFQMLTGNKKETQNNKEKLFLDLLHEHIDNYEKSMVIKIKRFSVKHPKYSYIIRAQNVAEKVYQTYIKSFDRRSVYNFYLTVAFDEAKSNGILLENQLSKHSDKVIEKIEGFKLLEMLSDKEKEQITEIKEYYYGRLGKSARFFRGDSAYNDSYIVLLNTLTVNKVEYTDWIDAQFSQLKWRKSVVAPTDLYGKQAQIRFENHNNKET